MKLLPALVLASLALLPMAASAQWQWMDKNNKKVYSDTAPPAEIPEKDILRRPPGMAARSTPAPPNIAPSDMPAPVAGAPAAPSTAGAAPLPKPAGVDKELEEKTRKAEEAEKARAAAEAQRMAAAKAENCARAREGKATFDSGIRVARMNAQGEREIIDDKARAAEQQRLAQVIASDCR